MSVETRARNWFQGSTVNGVKTDVQGLLAELERQKGTKHDYVVDGRSITMTVNDGVPSLEFPLPGEGDEVGKFAIKSRAHNQIALKTKIPGRYYDRMLVEAPDLLAQNVNRWMTEPKQRMVRTLDGKVRALLSKHFRTLDNADLFFAAFEVFKEVGAEVVRADLSEDRFYVRAINPNVKASISKGDDILGGVVLSNSETGHGALKVEQFALRLVCSNGILGEDVFSRMHFGEALDEGIYTAETINESTKAVWLQARDFIKHAFSDIALGEWARFLREGKKIEIPEPTKLAQGSWSGFDVTDKEKNDVLKHLLGDGEGLTKFGLSQALTATARDHNEADRRAELERMGYRVATMDAEQFDTLMAQACTVPTKGVKA